mgnify:FL=1
MENFVKFNYFHKEQTKKFQSDIRQPENLYYNEQEDFFVCPMGQKMKPVGNQKRTSKNGYTYEVAIYQAFNCKGCPLRGACHKPAGNREIEINKKLIKHKKKARENLTSALGLELRKRRCSEVEQTFGQLKENMGFKRFLLRGLPKVTIEIGLLCMAHNVLKLSNMLKKRGFPIALELLLKCNKVFYAFLEKVIAKTQPVKIQKVSLKKNMINFVIFKEAA